MARITVEDCIDKFDSRFELVLVASNRARKLHSGEEPTVEKNNDKNSVIALREIAEETISADEFKQSLVEEYQSVSPIDEEELALEFDNENHAEENSAADEFTEDPVESKSTEELVDIKKTITETNNNEESNPVSETQTDQSS